MTTTYAQREQATTPQHSADASRHPEAAAVPVAPLPQSSSFLNRAWLVALLTVALVMFGVFWAEPSWAVSCKLERGSLICDGVRGKIPVGFILLALYAAIDGIRRSNIKRFHPEIAAEEERKEVERKKLRKKVRRVGWIVFAGSIPISVAAMMIIGSDLEGAVLISLFGAFFVGLLGWVLSALYFHATGRSQMAQQGTPADGRASASLRQAGR